MNITGVANIGGPIASLTDSGFGFTQDVLQINDSLTWIRGAHSFKAGIDFQNVKDTRTSAAFQLYTFPSAAAYLAAREDRPLQAVQQLQWSLLTSGSFRFNY